jgi:hypothetical protein
VLRKVHADGSNLSTKWITIKNVKDIICTNVSFVDKVALFYRLLLPQWLADYILLKVLIRRNALSKADVDRAFSIGNK